MPKKSTQADFIAKAQAAHGERYDYSRVVYVNSATKVEIVCPEHGPFLQEANSHLQGVRCPGCSGKLMSNAAEFIRRARVRHGERYDYSRAIYVNSATKVEIVCPEHGASWQNVNAHLSSNSGCPECAPNAKLDASEFVNRAKAKFGEHYDYSRVVYMGRKVKVRITCPVHGVFSQTPEGHLLGYGCKKCGLLKGGEQRKYDKAAFVSKAQSVHGKLRYDYSQTKYLGSDAKVRIFCRLHGEFEQLPPSHLFGAGCPTCGSAQAAASHLHDQNTFLQLAHQAHGERYDYSRAAYVSATEKVEIICPEHGLFKQVAGAHTQGRGCKKCGTLEMAKARAYDTSQFISLARAKHGERYDYSRAHYSKGGNKIKIICLTHGVFEQVASTHIAGHGCPACARNALNQLNRLTWVERAAGRPCVLYFIRLYAREETFYKVGITSQTIATRYKSKKDLAPYSYEILAQHTSTDAARIWDWEQSILETFAHLRYPPRCSFGGASECFSSCEEILEIFPL